jgi:hypothetical protein
VEQRHRGFLRHPRVAIGAARDNGLGQPEHAAHALYLVKGNDELHLGGARIGEANLNARGDKGSDDAFCSVHTFLPFREQFLSMKKIYPFCKKVSMALFSWNVIPNRKEYAISLPNPNSTRL